MGTCGKFFDGDGIRLRLVRSVIDFHLVADHTHIVRCDVPCDHRCGGSGRTHDPDACHFARIGHILEADGLFRRFGFVSGGIKGADFHLDFSGKTVFCISVGGSFEIVINNFAVDFDDVASHTHIVGETAHGNADGILIAGDLRDRDFAALGIGPVQHREFLRGGNLTHILRFVDGVHHERGITRFEFLDGDGVFLRLVRFAVDHHFVPDCAHIIIGDIPGEDGPFFRGGDDFQPRHTVRRDHILDPERFFRRFGHIPRIVHGNNGKCQFPCRLAEIVGIIRPRCGADQFIAQIDPVFFDPAGIPEIADAEIHRRTGLRQVDSAFFRRGNVFDIEGRCRRYGNGVFVTVQCPDGEGVFPGSQFFHRDGRFFRFDHPADAADGHLIGCNIIQRGRFPVQNCLFFRCSGNLQPYDFF